MRWLLLALSFAAFVTAKDRDQQVLDELPLAPPELAADAMIKVVETGLIVHPKQKRDLLVGAFDLAGSAAFATALTPAVAAARDTDSDAGMQVAALAKGIDTLSLRCRAAKAMLSLDRRRAREMLDEASYGRLTAPSCRDATRPAVEILYETLKAFTEDGFTNDERKRGRPAEYVGRFLGSVTTASQIYPAIGVLTGYQWSDDEFARLCGVFIAAVANMSSPSDREFAATFDRNFTAMDSLIRACSEHHFDAGVAVRAWKSLAQSSLKAARCAENTDGRFEAEVIRSINSQLLPYAKDAGSLAANATVSVDGGRASVVELWGTGTMERKILSDYKRLRFGDLRHHASVRPDGLASPLTMDERRSPEWGVAAREFRPEMDTWKRDFSEAELVHFHQVCLMYSALLDITPSGQFEDAILEDYIGFLARSDVERQSPPEWALHVNRLLERSPIFSDLKVEKIRAEVAARGSAPMALLVSLRELTGERRDSKRRPAADNGRH